MRSAKHLICAQDLLKSIHFIHIDSNLQALDYRVAPSLPSTRFLGCIALVANKLRYLLNFSLKLDNGQEDTTNCALIGNRSENNSKNK